MYNGGNYTFYCAGSNPSYSAPCQEVSYRDDMEAYAIRGATVSELPTTFNIGFIYLCPGLDDGDIVDPWDDFLKIEIRKVGVTEWLQVDQFDNVTTTWTSVGYYITDSRILKGTGTYQVRFIFYSDGSNTDKGYYIDNVVFSYACTPPSKPGWCNATDNKCDYIDVTWENVANEDGYEIYRDQSSTPFDQTRAGETGMEWPRFG